MGGADPMGLYGFFRRLSENERLSIGERAAAERCTKASEDLGVALLGMDLAAHDAAGAMRDFGATWIALDARDSLDEAEEIAQHPDLAELNAMLDGYYGVGGDPMSDTV